VKCWVDASSWFFQEDVLIGHDPVPCPVLLQQALDPIQTLATQCRDSSRYYTMALRQMIQAARDLTAAQGGKPRSRSGSRRRHQQPRHDARLLAPPNEDDVAKRRSA
jgi:hypothetical protein